MKSKFELRATKQQLEAFKDESSNILVAASAGSGKTAVLVERIVYKLVGHYLEDDDSDERNLLQNIENLLVVTFTNKAAKQMKDRVEKVLRERLVAIEQLQKTNPAKAKTALSHIHKQLLTLNISDISTMDSFCSRLLKRYYYALDIDPDFRILADQAESEMIKADVWEKVREKYYQNLAENLEKKKADSFLQVCQMFNTGKDDDALTDIIMSMDTYANANANPDEWLEHLADLYISEGNIEDSNLWQEYLFPDVKQQLTQIEKRTHANYEAYQKFDEKMRVFWENTVFGAYFEGKTKAKQNYDQDIKKRYTKFEEIKACFERQARELANLSAHCQEYMYEKLQEQLQIDFKVPTLRAAGKSKGDYPADLADVWKKIKSEKDAISDDINKLTKRYFLYTKTEFKEVLAESYRVVKKLVEITRVFRTSYKKEKMHRHLLDYSDMEHLALELMTGNSEEKKRIQQALQAKYTEVMVDEYQDTNGLQEALLNAIAQNKNCTFFMVGDVKQSIYRFRLADPSLFISKYHSYKQNSTRHKLIKLPQNYRSAKNVTDFTNLIFTQIMDEKLGEINYADDKLISANEEYAKNMLLSKIPTEVLIYETDDKKMDEKENTLDFTIDSKEQAQIDIISAKINELVDKKDIYDRELGSMRKIKYQDIAILASTHRDGALIAEEFKKQGIAISVSDTNNYFKTTEIQIMLALLKIIDNPHQDIPLVAVLRSPLYEFDENELSYLRIMKKNGDFYGTLKHFKMIFENNQDKLFRFKLDNDFMFEKELADKVNTFLNDLAIFRELARTSELASLIWKIYEQTGFLEYVSGMPGGAQRLANLHALYERAADYEKISYKGIFQFLRFIQQMQANNDDLAELEVHQDSNAVSFMTIHKSKGLEFPIVFLINTSTQFNMRNINNNSYILDDKLGMGIKLINEETNFKADIPENVTVVAPSMVYEVIKQRQHNLALAEEMRKLYVGLTRAEQRLYIVGYCKDAQELLTSWNKSTSQDQLVLDEKMRADVSKYIDWIGLALMRHANITEYVQTATDRDLDFDFETVGNNSAKLAQVPFKVEFWNKEEVQASLSQVINETGINNAKRTFAEWEKKQLEKTDVDIEEIKNILEYKYPDIKLTQTTAYQAVTDIKRLFDDPDNSLMDNIEITNLSGAKLNFKTAEKDNFSYGNHPFKRPEFITTEINITPRAVGTATHLIFQHLPLTMEITAKVVQETIDKLKKAKLITDELIKQVNIEGIIQLYQTKLGLDIQQNMNRLEREMPFSLIYPASGLFDSLDTDSDYPILIHGIIDGCFKDSHGEITIFDYKTDHVTPKNNIKKIKGNYQGQLNLYSLALQSITGKKVAHRYLYLVDSGQVIEL